jgi:hypothetical protein
VKKAFIFTIIFMATSCFGLPTAHAQQQTMPVCQANSASCPAGLQGPGGCYATTRTICVQGRLCPIGSAICLKGPLGPGGCYNQQVAQCVNGSVFYMIQSPYLNPPQ